MDYIKRLSTQELQAEIERRRQPQIKPPPVLEHPDLTKLIKTVVDGVNQCIKDEYEDEDLKHYVYEEALKAIYGPGIINWWKNRGY